MLFPRTDCCFGWTHLHRFMTLTCAEIIHSLCWISNVLFQLFLVPIKGSLLLSVCQIMGDPTRTIFFTDKCWYNILLMLVNTSPKCYTTNSIGNNQIWKFRTFQVLILRENMFLYSVFPYSVDERGNSLHLIYLRQEVLYKEFACREDKVTILKS